MGILLYIAQDRPDLQFAVQRLASGMSNPKASQAHCILLQEHAGLVLQTQEHVYRMCMKRFTKEATIFPQTGKMLSRALRYFRLDWAGDRTIRKSTSSATFSLAAASAVSEGIHIKEVITFLTRKRAILTGSRI